MLVCATKREMLMALDDTGIGGWWLVTGGWWLVDLAVGKNCDARAPHEWRGLPFPRVLRRKS